MPNLIPTSLSLWAGIYNVIFAFRAGAAGDHHGSLRPPCRRSPASSQRFQLRSTVLPPAAMTMLADDPEVDHDRSRRSGKYVRSISAPLSPLQARRFRDRFGINVLNGWGQTELGGEVVGWSAADAKVSATPTSVRSGARTRTVRAVDPSCADLPVDDAGEILVRTPMIERAGLRQTGTTWTAGSRPTGGSYTGDLGRLDDVEGFLWIEGRVSDMINRSGLKVFPEEVAEVIRLWRPTWPECAVGIGVPDDRLGVEVPWAFALSA